MKCRAMSIYIYADGLIMHEDNPHYLLRVLFVWRASLLSGIEICFSAFRTRATLLGTSGGGSA